MNPPPPADFLTARRRVILAALAEHIRTTGYAPTFRGILKMTGIRSTSIVAWHVRRLVDAGYVVVPTDEHGAMLAHTMKLTERGERAAQDPQSLALWNENRPENAG